MASATLLVALLEVKPFVCCLGWVPHLLHAGITKEVLNFDGVFSRESTSG